MAPYGMAATLTGVTYREGDPKLNLLLDEWANFWPLTNNSYSCKDADGVNTPMPEGVEVGVVHVFS